MSTPPIEADSAAVEVIPTTTVAPEETLSVEIGDSVADDTLTPPIPDDARRWFLLFVAGIGIALAAILPFALRAYGATLGPLEMLLALFGTGTAAWSATRLRQPHRTEALISRIEAACTRRYAALLGVLIALPVTRFTGDLVVDTDSARLIAAVRHAERYGYRSVRETQEPLIPHLLFRPALAIGDLPAARLVPIVLTLALVGLVAMCTWHWTRSLVATIAASVALTLVSVTLDQVWRLPLYPGMLLVGYGAVFCTVEATRQRGRTRIAFAVASGVAVALAPEFQTVGQLFYAAPAIALIACVRTGRRTIAWVAAWSYGAAALATIPRFLINYSIDKMSYIRSGRVEWMVQDGYLARINDVLRDTPTRREYITRGPEILGSAFGRFGFVLLIFVALSLLVVPWRVRIAAAAAGLLVFGGMVVQRPGPFPRYFEPLIPGMAMLLGVLFAWLVLRPDRWARWAAGALVGAVAIVGGMNYHDKLSTARKTESDRSVGRFSIMSNIVGNQSVFGVRATKLIGYNSDADVWGTATVTKQEFLDYLAFDEDAIVAMAEKYGIDYIAVTDTRRNEKEYHQYWSIPDYRVDPIHLKSLGKDIDFCPVWRDLPQALYKIGRCAAGEYGMFNDGERARKNAEKFENPTAADLAANDRLYKERQAFLAALRRGEPVETTPSDTEPDTETDTDTSE